MIARIRKNRKKLLAKIVNMKKKNRLLKNQFEKMSKRIIVLKSKSRGSKNFFDYQTFFFKIVYNFVNSQFFFSIQIGSFSNVRNFFINFNIVHFKVESFDHFFEKQSEHFEQHFVDFSYFSKQSESASEN